jgi:hypothetical protein
VPYLGSAEDFKDGVVNPHTYITNNRNKVDYPAYKSQSLYIGSGPIESSLWDSDVRRPLLNAAIYTEFGSTLLSFRIGVTK